MSACPNCGTPDCAAFLVDRRFIPTHVKQLDCERRKSARLEAALREANRRILALAQFAAPLGKSVRDLVERHADALDEQELTATLTVRCSMGALRDLHAVLPPAVSAALDEVEAIAAIAEPRR